MPTRSLAVHLVAMLVLAGCVQPDGSDATPAAPDPLPAEPVPRTQVFHFEADIEQGLGVNAPDPILEEWLFEAGTYDDVELVFAWETPAYRFYLDIENPAGDSTRLAPDAGSDEARIDAPFPYSGAGPYTVHVRLSGPMVGAEHVELDLTAHWVELVSGNATSTPPTAPGAGEVRVEREGNGWIARRAHHAASVDAAPTVALDLAGVNGALTVLAGDGVDVTATAWARGSTEAEARARLDSIKVTVRATASEASASARTDRWDQKGMDAVVLVDRDSTLTGTMSTANGAVMVSDGHNVAGLSATTTNGAVAVNAQPSGRLTLATTNGAVVGELAPLDSFELRVTTTNGAVELALKETEAVAYVLAASTVNGPITESMEEAELEGDAGPGYGAIQRTLRTIGGSDRPIQVTGSVQGTNTGIDFQHA